MHPRILGMVTKEINKINIFEPNFFSTLLSFRDEVRSSFVRWTDPVLVGFRLKINHLHGLWVEDSNREYNFLYLYVDSIQLSILITNFGTHVDGHVS